MSNFNNIFQNARLLIRIYIYYIKHCNFHVYLSNYFTINLENKLWDGLVYKYLVTVFDMKEIVSCYVIS